MTMAPRLHRIVAAQPNPLSLPRSAACAPRFGGPGRAHLYAFPSPDALDWIE